MEKKQCDICNKELHEMKDDFLYTDNLNVVRKNLVVTRELCYCGRHGNHIDTFKNWLMTFSTKSDIEKEDDSVYLILDHLWKSNNESFNVSPEQTINSLKAIFMIRFTEFMNSFLTIKNLKEKCDIDFQKEKHFIKATKEVFIEQLYGKIVDFIGDRFNDFDTCLDCNGELQDFIKKVEKVVIE